MKKHIHDGTIGIYVGPSPESATNEVKKIYDSTYQELLKQGGWKS